MRTKTPPNRLLLLTCLLFSIVDVSPAQEPEKYSGPRTELLTMNGGKPGLSATGEGIVSFKSDEIYKRGKMTVRPIKPDEMKLFKVELPIGYTLYNDLIYVIDTDISSVGPSEITFNLPSARTKETFAQLRILYPEIDYAEPEVPRWVDATLDADSEEAQRYLSETDIKQRLSDFKTRTLHAFTDRYPICFLVALRDPAKARNKLAADLQLSGSGQAQVIEGQKVTCELKITNAGPATATGIRLHADPSFPFVSVAATQGKCGMMGQNVYCKIASLEKDQSVDIKIVERCEWDRTSSNGLTEGDNPRPIVGKVIRVGSIEQDPEVENNHLYLQTEVYTDQNKGPVIEVLSPAMSQLFNGPRASVPIRFKASDPDGFIKKVELFDADSGKSLGEATLQSEGEYELIYKDVGLGNRSVAIVATDNLGRVASEQTPWFYVNGPAKVEITSPKAGSIFNRDDGEITVTINAFSPSSSIKKVSLASWNSAATPVGNDNYVLKLKSCLRKCQLEAIAVDDKGIESRSEAVEFTIASAPTVYLSWFDGETVQQFKPGKALKVSQLLLVASAEHESSYAYDRADIAKIDIFIDGALVCTDTEPMVANSAFECVWKPAPGKYKLHAIATDADGAKGKSEVIEVVIERP